MEKHEMKKNEKYMLAVHELFQLIDMERLDDSLNRDNREYANDVIKLMGMTHEIIYGNPSEPDEGEDTVILPAVIRDKESGKSWVGIAECSYFSLPKNLPMYELLQGRALSIEEFHIPREYQAVNLPSEDKLYGHSLTVTVFVGENLTVECSMTVEREEEEMLEEEEETAMTISEKRNSLSASFAIVFSLIKSPSMIICPLAAMSENAMKPSNALSYCGQ